MKLKALFLVFLMSFLSAPLMAGSGDDHGHSHDPAPVDQAMATTYATKVVAALVERKKLDESWTAVSVSSVEKKVFGDNTEWVAVFVNDKMTDTDKQKLYVFLTLGGDYIAANFTGE